MELNYILNLESLRAVEPITRILSCFIRLCRQIFVTSTSNNGYMRLLISTIMGQPFLLVSVSLLIIGFVIAIIKRMISI